MSTYIELPVESGGGGGGTVNSASNVGTGSGVFKALVGSDLQFKTLIGGAGITLTPGANDITIDATGSGAGDVTGPASAVDSEIVLFSGVTGKIIKRATGTGVVKSTSGVFGVGAVSLTAEVSGVLPVANGGTNSSAALSNNRVMASLTGAVAELPAITALRALESDASGLPVASATTAAELGFVAGVTSSIQTQLNTNAGSLANKVDKVASTDNAIVRFDGATGDVQNSGVTISDTNAVVVPGSVSFTGASAFFIFPNLTTVQRDALTPAGGMAVYNTTVHTLQVYVAGTINNWVDALGWGA